LLLKEKAQTLNAETELWGIFKACFVGRIYIRHHLTDALREVGGHIGYETAPAFRRMGVGSAMLSQALPIAKSLGLSEVLMTCDDNNLASIKIIEKNGGILREKKQIAQGKPIKRYYWIVL
jgi:predicted acetyltransferase